MREPQTVLILASQVIGCLKRKEIGLWLSKGKGEGEGQIESLKLIGICYCI